MRFQRLRNARLRPRFVTAVRPLPTMVTLGNLLCGFGSVCLAMLSSRPPSDLNPAAALNANACLYWSGLLIFIAMLFDVMDGRVARWTRMSSRFGMEMDSLADMISFGLAPAMLVKAAIENYDPGLAVSLHAGVGRAVAHAPANLALHVPERYIWLMLATYIACTALRLARYNVEAESGHRNFFFGLPSPGAAGCVAGLIILTTPTRPKPDLGILQPLQEQMAPLTVLRSPESANLVLVCLPFLMMCLGILMVSRVHYLHVGDKLFGGRRSLMHLLLIGLGLVLIIMQHEIVLATTFVGYMLLGLVNEVRFQLFPSQRPAGWVVSADDLGQKPADRGAVPPAAPAAPGAAAPASAPGAVR